MEDDKFRLLLVMPTELNDSIESVASQLNQTKSMFIRECLRQHIEHLTKWSPKKIKLQVIVRGLGRMSYIIGTLWQRAKSRHYVSSC